MFCYTGLFKISISYDKYLLKRLFLWRLKLRSGCRCVYTSNYCKPEKKVSVIPKPENLFVTIFGNENQLLFKYVKTCPYFQLKFPVWIYDHYNTETHVIRFADSDLSRVVSRKPPKKVAGCFKDVKLKTLFWNVKQNDLKWIIARSWVISSLFHDRHFEDS